MRKIATTTLAGLAIAFSASDLSAQICNGTAPFSVGSMQAAAMMAFPTNATTIGGQFNMGTASGLFGGVSLSTTSFDGVSESQTGFGLHGGKSMTPGTNKKVDMCPQVFFNHFSGPNSGTFTESMNAFGAGLTFGTTMAQGSFDIVPFGGATIERDMASVTSGGTSADASDNNFDLVAGAGFVLGKAKKWTVRPAIDVPLTNNRDATISIMGSMNFGGKPK